MVNVITRVCACEFMSERHGLDMYKLYSCMEMLEYVMSYYVRLSDNVHSVQICM